MCYKCLKNTSVEDLWYCFSQRTVGLILPGTLQSATRSSALDWLRNPGIVSSANRARRQWNCKLLQFISADLEDKLSFPAELVWNLQSTCDTEAMRVQRIALSPPIEPWPICNRNSCDVDCILTSHTPRHWGKRTQERINSIILCYVRLEDYIRGLGKSLWTGSFVILADSNPSPSSPEICMTVGQKKIRSPECRTTKFRNKSQKTRKMA